MFVTEYDGDRAEKYRDWHLVEEFVPGMEWESSLVQGTLHVMWDALAESDPDTLEKILTV
jgi:hypothetical protein